MGPFRHVILTRFNVRLPEHRPRGKDWLTHRFRFFERFCLPSVRSQSHRNFDWVIFFDAATPREFVDRIQQCHELRAFRPVYVDGHFTQGTVQKAVSPLIAGCEHVITTRLDNDDAICRDFVAVIQDHFAAQKFTFLNFTHGYVWHRNDLYRVRHLSNSFISLVEQTGNVSTVFAGNHMHLSALGPVQQIPKPAAWMQVVHDRNLVNEVWGVPCPIQELRGSFEIDPECLGLLPG
jgi:hypothetical protein